MARGSKEWLGRLISLLSKDGKQDSAFHWRGRLADLNNGAQGQSFVFENLEEPSQGVAILEAALELAGFQQPEDLHAKKFHDALLRFYVHNPYSLPDLYKWSKNYHKAPHFKPLPEQREPLDHIVQTKKGTIRNPVHSLYRHLRGNAMINESKDFISAMPRIYDAQITTALTKLAKHGHIKYEPKTGVILIPRDTIRRIDPYYERYQETLNALQQAIGEDHALVNRVAASVSSDRDNEEARAAGEATFKYVNRPPEEQITKYKDFAKQLIQDQMRRNMPRIPEDLPMEEREQRFAEQQAQLQNINADDIHDGLLAMFNRSYVPKRNESWWPTHDTAPMMRLASMFSEKGLRSLLNNPKRALKIAQINELLEDKWADINATEATWQYHPDPEDRQAIPPAIFEILPNEVDRNMHDPGGPWKQGDLQSLNNYDTFRRQLEDRERAIERSRVQARERIVQYIAAHPELQQLAAQNVANQRRLYDMRGIGYTPNDEDKEEEAIIKSMGRQLVGNYRTVAKTLMDHPRLAELAKRPYTYSKGIMDAIGEAPITIAEHPGWRLANNRHELYERSYEHSICIGMPVMQYHDKALAKKSLLFFSGDHTDPESEAGEIALYIDPKTHKIIKTDVVQVHGYGNAPGKKESTQNLKYIADALVGKKVDDTDDVVEEKGVEYKEEQGPAQQEEEDPGELWDNAADEDEFDEDDEGYAEGGFVEPTGNPAYRRLLELLLEDGMTKPSKHLTSLATRRF
jgi:hypothetical protein